MTSSPPSNEPVSRSRARWLTIPNILCVIRLVGSMVLASVVLGGHPGWFLPGFLFLAITDWLDGKLAIWLQQQTSPGAVLDSVADAAMYATLLTCSVWLKGPLLLAEFAWIGIALATYAISIAAGIVKFGRLPSYHTYLAKLSAFLMLVATICLFCEWSIWPLRIATAVISLGNLEAIAITRLLPAWRPNVWSLYHVFRRLPEPHGKPSPEKRPVSPSGSARDDVIRSERRLPRS